jgi:hypothetical protein
MRWKIIVVNGTIVVLLGLLTFALLRASLDDILSDRGARRVEAERAVRSANTLLELQSLRLERWLAERASEENVSGVFSAGTPEARSESARFQANRLREAASKSALLGKVQVPLVLFVDARGVVLGRNDSNQMRGDDLGRAYPSIGEALRGGQTSSHIWFNRQRSEQLLASYAPVHAEGSGVIGMLIAATTLSDERLGMISDQTSGQALTLGSLNDQGSLEIIAEGGSAAPRVMFAAMRRPDVLARARAAIDAGGTLFDDASNVFAAEPLNGSGGTSFVLLSALTTSLVPTVAGLLWPIFAVTLLGLVLVVAAGTFLGNYISQPISELEEGLLSVINGRTNHRFELEHPDLGGLVSRINSLLDALMGVPETDLEGRTSSPPGAPYREAEP